MRAKLWGMVGAILVLVTTQVANAGWMSAFSGYSAFRGVTSEGVTDGYVSFAVWDRGTGDPGLPTGASKMVWDGTSFKSSDSFSGRYIYFYQVVNAQTGTDALSAFRIYDRDFLQVGYITETVFKDSQGEINSGNPALDNGQTGHPISGDDVVDGSPSLSGITPSELVNPSGTPRAPSSITINAIPAYTQWNFSTTTISQSESSLLLFVTSDLGPAYRKADARDGTTPDFDVPATPEPGTFAALVGVAGTASVLGRLRRRRRTS